MVVEELQQRYADQLLNLSLDTIDREKQALVFCNTKRGAESQAEKIAAKIKLSAEKQRLFNELSEQALSALESPTKQCRRLAKCLKGGTAFHHAGLHSKQRELIEEEFRKGTIYIICSTPTLAMGLDLPAFRSIIRDVKRFTASKGWGLTHIPVLEYEQMAGRAGRPGKEDFGEAIIVSGSAADSEDNLERYVNGDPEEIYSKLAVEPVLRTYVLTLISTGFVKDVASLYAFFDKTFYAYQYADVRKLHAILDKMIALLDGWGFIKTARSADGLADSDEGSAANLFVSADEVGANMENISLRATAAGKRVSELYLDPLTANFLIEHLQNAKKLRNEGLLHLLASTLELRPLLRPRTKDYNLIDEWLVENDGLLLVAEPTQFSYEYDEFLASIKTAMFMLDWINEVGEEVLLERFGIRPGEIKAKTDVADWLLYSCEELARLLGMQRHLSALAKMRVRLQYGVKEEILNLLRFKGIGKVRARKLYVNGICSVGDVKNTDASILARLIGPSMAKHLKEQVGQPVDKLEVRPRKRKGQKNLGDWR